MLNINFNLRDANSENETPVVIILRYKGQRLKYPSGLKINPKYWNIKDQKAKQTEKFAEHPEINSRIKNLIAKINKVFMNYMNENDDEVPGVETLKHLIDVKLERVEVKKYTLFSYFQKYIDNMTNRVNNKTGKIISKTSKAVYQNTLNILEEFQKTYKRKISFETIDMDFYHDFTEYLTGTRKQSINTIGKLIRNIKVVMNDATENGYNKNLSYKSKRFISVSEKSFSIYLNDDELTELYNLDLSHNKKLDRVRDLFLIGCYTGLRYSDYSNIKPENVNVKENLLTIETHKTGATVAIPLHARVNAILKKYNHVLPKSMSNQKTNEYLKDLGKKDINKNVPCLHEQITKVITKGGFQVETNLKKYDLLSSHTARRSFATNLYLSGFPAISIMKITGHTTEKSFMKYIKVTPTENAKLLQLHWDNEPKLKRVK